MLFAKSKVYIHPSASAKDNIPGFLALVRPPGASDKDVLLAWVPESYIKNTPDYDSYVKVDLDTESMTVVTSDVPSSSSSNTASLSSSSPSSSSSSSSTVLVSKPAASSLTSYAFSIPLSSIYSLQARPPSLGWWWGSIIIHTRDSETMPALFFHDNECPSTIQIQKQRNKDFDPFDSSGDLFWGGDQFLKTLDQYATLERSTLETSIILVNPEPEDRRSFSPKTAKVVTNESGGLYKAINDAKWSLLEKLAQVTKLSRRAAQNVIDHSPPSVRNLLNQPEVQKIGDEFDSARVYLAKWAMGIAEEAEKSRKKVVWNDEIAYRDILKSTVGGFELLDIDYQPERRNEVGKVEWNAFFDHTGRLSITIDEVKDRIFHGGVSPEIRNEVWLFLLDVYPWDSSSEDRRSIISEKRNEYYRYKRKWWEDIDKQEGDDFWKDQKSRIEKDVHRTDRNISLFEESDTPHPDPNSRYSEIGTNLHLEQLKDLLITYNEYNTNLGYVQGMSDLLSPLYVVFQDDAITFWAFCNFMERMERNFLRDQSGMRQQMLTLDQLVQLMLPELYHHLEKADSTNFFFFFRMLLVWFKREFEWDDVLRLWEVLWTDYLSSQFILFVALAILDKNKDVIMTHLKQFDEVLKYMNELSMHMNLEDILTRAELLFRKFEKTIDMIDKKKQLISSNDSTASEYEKDPLPTISPELRQLLSRKVIVVHEVERPPGATGG